MAAMFLRCGSHPLSGAEIPPTLRPSPASRKPSSTAHCTKCLLWRPPGAPRDSKPVTVRNSSVDDPLACPPASTSPPQHPGWGRPFVTRAGASEGSSQSRRELRAPAVEFPPFSLRAVPACCWCRGARGRGHEPCVGDWGTLHREEGGHSSL